MSNPAFRQNGEGETGVVEIAEVLGYTSALWSKKRPYTVFLHHQTLGATAKGQGYTRKIALTQASERAIAQYQASFKAVETVLPSPKETGDG